ncbi:MAG: transketolase family protein [Treponemataceae bacterium]|nr:MAG: transketolase family protein [Treponemataceae bacterium]
MSVAMRDAFGSKLAELGNTNKKIVVLDADVSSSTKSANFAKAFPDRFFNCGVAEGNMVGVAAGLASAGFHPAVNTFAIFLVLKGLDQIRHDFCYNHLPLVIAGSYGGFSDSFDGASHQIIEDIAIMRALPNMEVLVPGDAKQAEAALDYAFTRTHPVYIRLCRNAVDELPGTVDFAAHTPLLLRQGKDVTIAATGIMAGRALAAADLLKARGVDAEVFSVPCIKPMDASLIASSLAKTKKLVTVEEHSIMGGFGSALLENLAAAGGVSFSYTPVGVNDRFGDTGPYDALLSAYGLDAEGIAKQV